MLVELVRRKMMMMAWMSAGSLLLQSLLLIDGHGLMASVLSTASRLAGYPAQINTLTCYKIQKYNGK